MTKTRSQTSNAVIKQEQEYDNSHLLGGVSSSTANTGVPLQQMAETRNQASNVVVKKEQDFEDSQVDSTVDAKVTECENEPVTTFPKVKLEEETDIKFLLQVLQVPPKAQKRSEGREERIKRFIDCIKNRNMTIKAASKEVNVCYNTGLIYRSKYLEGPIKKVDGPRKHNTKYTEQQIKALIGYIADDGMTIRDAAIKTNMTYSAGRYHYNKYFDGPKHSVSKPCPVISKKKIACWKENANKLVGYIANDNMTIKAAADKAGVSDRTAKKHYNRYLKNNGYDIPKKKPSDNGKHYTQQDVKQLIDYIVNDKMRVKTASKKLKMGLHTAEKYYRRYLADPQRRIPVLNKLRGSFTHGQLRALFGYLANDKMSMLAASLKVGMNENTAKKYYLKYLNDPEYKRLINNK